MKTTKFRGLSLETPNKGEWAVGSLFHDLRDGMCSIFDKQARYWMRVDPATVGQFTGLTDKNGKEIYEGDIVKWNDGSNGVYWRFAVVEICPDIVFNCELIQEVNGVKNSTQHVFRYGRFAYKDTHNHLEIIGNIHSNPELLKNE